LKSVVMKQKVGKMPPNADSKLHDCPPLRLVLELGISVYRDIAFCAYSGHKGIHRFDPQTLGGNNHAAYLGSICTTAAS